ncbi:NADH-quinone oxidoreductase subunit NuoE [Entomobacter blattae]|uniref:NADH-quinone oxidoreductase chain 2 n=1 Tax=Entomobacter blattae TaxID=2762277 RepID=A0A7H1NSX3_9PROT|nr:NADH-quinone oxidoreductase subunit NuoE [Entomobacter blattae]QNT78883.1 NADH-quinone oxidoreductase chain 2 [Entomobacter blattae]
MTETNDTSSHAGGEEPKSFSFSEANKSEIAKILQKYPSSRKASAVMPLLYLVQNQILEETGRSWIPKVAMDEVAMILDMAPIRVYEVASFYTMFNTQPVGRFHLQVCRTTACWLKGSDDVVEACKKSIGVDELGQTSSDGLFTLSEVECLGACANAPVLQINNDYFEDLTPQDVTDIIEKLKKGEKVTPGTVANRLNSAPEGGLTVLTDTSSSVSQTDKQ